MPLHLEFLTVIRVVARGLLTLYGGGKSAKMEDLSDFVLWKQGAEGKLYRGDFLGYPAVVKERFPKKYRHPTLDQHLTQERFKSEARMLTRCKNAGT